MPNKVESVELVPLVDSWPTSLIKKNSTNQIHALDVHNAFFSRRKGQQRTPRTMQNLTILCLCRGGMRCFESRVEKVIVRGARWNESLREKYIKDDAAKDAL